MKKLLSVADVKLMNKNGEREFYADDNTLITPAARDAAKEFGIKIIKGAPVNIANCCTAPDQAPPPTSDSCSAGAVSAGDFDAATVRQIVEQVVAAMGGDSTPNFTLPKCNRELVRAIDPQTGFMLIKGNSVAMEPFNDGQRDRPGVMCKEVTNQQESPNITGGFMEFDHSELTWTLTYDELDYVIDGTLEFIVNGKKYTGLPGDVFFIPASTTVTFTTPDKTRFFFVTYPANWAELCGVR